MTHAEVTRQTRSEQSPISLETTHDPVFVERKRRAFLENRAFFERKSPRTHAGAALATRPLGHHFGCYTEE